MSARDRQRSFHLGSLPAGAGLDPILDRGLIPALAARYRDLSALRYDYPVVLLQDPCDGEFFRPLSSIIDDVLREAAVGDDADRIASHVLALEGRLRLAAARGESGRLSVLWERAAGHLAGHAEPWQDSMRRARAALTIDGELHDCGRGLPGRLLRHGFEAAARGKGARFHAQAQRLATQLSEILRAGLAYSANGRTSAALRSSFGGPHQRAFDFDVLAATVAAPAPATTITDARSQRLRALVAALTGQRFFPAPGETGLPFVFTSCVAALRAYRERLPELLDLVRALGAAELEAAGQYNDARHGAFFDQLRTGGIAIDPRDLAMFPDYFVELDAGALSANEHSALLEILDSRLPIKVALAIDDVLPAALSGEGGRGRARQLAQVAAGLGTAFVVQAPASHLVQMREALARGLACAGPALFSVFDGSSPALGGVSPYLVCALALESRVFPALTFEPGTGADGGRLDVSMNPQREADWPVYPLEYETGARGRASEPVAITGADLLVCDTRHARHFAGVPAADWTDALVPVSRWLTLGAADRRAAIPYIPAVDDDNRLQRIIVDAAVVRETEDCLEHWRSLRRLASAVAPDQPAGREAPEPVPVAAASVEAPTPAVAPVATGEGRAPGEPFIETPRCSSCNECIQLNNRMFKYNENQQAYIADASAGTFRELVEAAESCQVSIIHPGAPRRQDEPGLEDLIQRAAAFA